MQFWKENETDKGIENQKGDEKRKEKKGGSSNGNIENNSNGNNNSNGITKNNSNSNDTSNGNTQNNTASQARSLRPIARPGLTPLRVPSWLYFGSQNRSKVDKIFTERALSAREKLYTGVSQPKVYEIGIDRSISMRGVVRGGSRARRLRKERSQRERSCKHAKHTPEGCEIDLSMRGVVRGGTREGG